MGAIFKREYKTYFENPIGYVFLLFALLLGGWFFSGNCLLYQSSDLNGFFSNLNIIYLFLIPILTMRLLAEDKRNKTDQILLTSPVTVTDVVLGKYLAALALIGTATAIMLIYPLILTVYGTPAWGAVISQFIGFFLLGGSLLSVGLFISSLTESQIASALITFAFMMFIWLSDWIKSTMSNPIAVKMIEWLSLLNRFQDFTTGILNPSTIVYLITFAAVFVFLTIQTVEKRRWN